MISSTSLALSSSLGYCAILGGIAIGLHQAKHCKPILGKSSIQRCHKKALRGWYGTDITPIWLKGMSLAHQQTIINAVSRNR